MVRKRTLIPKELNESRFLIFRSIDLVGTIPATFSFITAQFSEE